jgi:hypothetical protein
MSSKQNAPGPDGVKYVVLDTTQVPPEPTAESLSDSDSDSEPEEMRAASESSDESNADANKTASKVGMTCELKNFYSGKEDKRGKFLWQEKIPKDIGEPVENAETAKYALLVRNIKVRITNETPFLFQC